MTHTDRLNWLKSHGWKVDERRYPIRKIGWCVELTRKYGEREQSMWLAIEDGRAYFDGDGQMYDWQGVVEWINPAPVEVKQEKKQKGLWNED